MKFIVCIILSLFSFSLSGCGLFEEIGNKIANIFEDIANMYNVRSTTDINEYGKFPVLLGKHRIENYTDIIMPDKIEDFFSDPIYYFGYCEAPYMNEVYLQVKIEDEIQYQSYVSELVKENPTGAFFYDDSFQEYVITDVLILNDDGEDGYIISKTEIQKILFSDESNTIIFISLIVLYQDMPFNVEDFYYFEKFKIDVEKYYDGERIYRSKLNELPLLY